MISNIKPKHGRALIKYKKREGIRSGFLPKVRPPRVPRSGNYNLPFKVPESSRSFVTDTRSANPTIGFSGSEITLASNVKSGTSNPNWRNIIAKGGDASTAYSVRGVVSAAGCKVSVSTDSYGSTMPSYRITEKLDIVCYGQINAQFTNDTETQNRALARFKRQLSSRVGNYQAMAPLAECKELGRLVNQASAYSVEFVKACLAARKTRGKSVWRYMQDYWLAFNFGLSPMLRDIDGIANAIAKHLARTDLHGRLSATATKKGLYTYTPVTSATTLGTRSVFSASGMAEYTLSYRYIGSFELFLESSNNWSMFNQLGLGWTSIPAAAWELLAFSWLADYFTNVGQFLEDRFESPPGDTNYLVMDRRYELTARHDFRLAVQKNVGFVQTRNEAGFAELKYFEFNRTPLAKLPHAGLYWKSMDTQAAYGVSKLLNLLAVLKI